MNVRCWKLGAVILLTALPGCASSGGAGNAAAVAPPAQGPADVYVVAATAAAPPLPTLPDFLGINQCKVHVGQTFGGISNFVHRLFPQLATAFPGAEGPPPLEPLSSPANLESSSPAVAAAAKIKQEEDQAQQKILALNYLASVGCGGCYPEVEDAFLAAMEDCTEDVRYAAVKAVKEAAGQPCTFCKTGACCSPAIRRKLHELSEHQDNSCCLTEPSPRVRRLARIALTYCGNDDLAPIPEIEGPVPVDDWEILPPAAVGREFNPLPPSRGPLDVVGQGNAPVPPAEAGQSPATDPRNVEELVAQWYQSVDPTLPMEEKKALLRAHLANYFRRESEEQVLLQTAKREYQFHQEVTSAFAGRQLSSPVSGDAGYLPPPGQVIMAGHAQPGPDSQNPSAEDFTAGLQVNWEQMELDFHESSRDTDIAMMNEVWRLVNQRQPNPGVRLQLDRVRVRTSGLVDLADVPNKRLRELLATLPVGTCSPVIISGSKIFIVRPLDRRSPLEKVTHRLLPAGLSAAP